MSAAIIARSSASAVVISFSFSRLHVDDEVPHKAEHDCPALPVDQTPSARAKSKHACASRSPSDGENRLERERDPNVLHNEGHFVFCA